MTSQMCHANVSHMKTTTIRGIRHNTRAVLSWVADGESVEVRKRGVPVAVLSPSGRKARIPRPDFMARIRSIYGDRVLPVTASELVAGARGDS